MYIKNHKVRFKISLIIFIILIIVQLAVSQQDVSKYWIFFKDRGNTDSTNIALSNLQKKLPSTVLNRRAKVLPAERLVTPADLPLCQAYLTKLKELKIYPIVQSTWLNAVSAELTKEQVNLVKKLFFVSKIQPVVRYIRPHLKTDVLETMSKESVHSSRLLLDYGNSFIQNNLMRVPEVHEMGINATGVLIGMLDTGFNYEQHEAFAKLNVIAEYDFIHQDNVTKNEPQNNDRANQHNHGTQTLSTIAGYKEEQLIGPAYGASYLLGKTEIEGSETIIEEDYWVAGIEWMEKKGVDVVNSSLGYNDWYTYSDMDGNTAITTIAADMAAQRGVVVVNSMGNEGSRSWKYMIAPADGESVISVGAVNSDGLLTYFSSLGPTADGRIKPDVVAMGAGVYVASPNSDSNYDYGSGTSFSSPLVAGVAALILSAHPYLTPIQVRDALRNTANNSNDPNYEYGWGLVDAFEALFYHGFFFSNLPTIQIDSLYHKINLKIFSKDKIVPDKIFLCYALYNEINFDKILMQPTTANNEYTGLIPIFPKNTKIKFYFSATASSGVEKTHPFDAPNELFIFYSLQPYVSQEKPAENQRTFVLYQNYPNPFNSITHITYDISVPDYVSLTVYNLRGQFVNILADGFCPINNYVTIWNGKDHRGNEMASGVYLYKLKVGQYLQTKKMLLLR